MKLSIRQLKNTVRRLLKESAHQERITRQFFADVDGNEQERGFGIRLHVGRASGERWYNGCIANTPELEGFTYICDGADEYGRDWALFLNAEQHLTVMVENGPHPAHLLCRCDSIRDAARCLELGLDAPKDLKLARKAFGDIKEFYLINQN